MRRGYENRNCQNARHEAHLKSKGRLSKEKLPWHEEGAAHKKVKERKKK